jgi:hypothetical protein
MVVCSLQMITPNKSLDASGGGVFRIKLIPAVLE